MRRHSLTRVRWTVLATALTFIASLVVSTGAAQAVVVDMSPSAHGQSSVPFDPTHQNYGVAMVPGTRGNLATPGIPTVTSSGPCSDPALPPDLILSAGGLCAHYTTTNGIATPNPVMHANETFALTWDQPHRYWATTRNYVEQFLSDVATGSGTFSSPYAVTGQYTDATGRAANASAFGGGCIDLGSVGGSCSQFGSANASGIGHDYPTTSGCTPSGSNVWSAGPNGPIYTGANDFCLTDAQVRDELTAMITQTGLRTQPGYTPLVVVLTPPGVVSCLDAAGTLCSANGGTSAQFCSYHSHFQVTTAQGPKDIAYVVQPWTATWSRGVLCDDSDAPNIPIPTPVDKLATDVGARLVSPLSQGHLAAIVNPGVNSWFGLNGSEINDNGCTPLGGSTGLDTETVGSGSYPLQREFNNAGAIESDPNALPCTPNVNLAPAFVVPSAVNQGDVIQFDGSTTVSSLMVPNAGYTWTFGDGTAGVGPSVVHSYPTTGTYYVTLKATDRGGSFRILTQTIQVLGPAGQPAPPPTTGPTTPPGPGQHAPGPGLHVRLQLMPQSLRAVLRSGVDIRVTYNARADGIVTVFVPQSSAKRAHIRFRSNANTRMFGVVIGRGTFSGTIKNGTTHMNLRLSRATAAKLSHLAHVTLTVQVALVDAGGNRKTIVAAGRY